MLTSSVNSVFHNSHVGDTSMLGQCSRKVNRGSGAGLTRPSVLSPIITALALIHITVSV